MQAFKFVPSSLIDGILERGSFRIGTSASFRPADGFEDGRADPREVSSAWRPGLKTMAARDFQRALGWPVNAPLGHMVSFQEQTRMISCADIYIFCFTLKLSQDCIENMRSKFECDACYRIKDVDRLAELMTAASPRFHISDNDLIPANACCIGDVVYNLPEDSTMPQQVSPLSKRPQFQWQCEGRMLWSGVAPREPFVVEIPEATSLLERVNL